MTATTAIDGLRTALLELTPAQQVAVEALAAGATQEKAAEAAGSRERRSPAGPDTSLRSKPPST